MRALQDSRYKPQSPSKNISIDDYDTDSDEEDQIREEEEIKRIINQGNIACIIILIYLAKARVPQKLQNLKAQALLNETNAFQPKPKLPVFTNLKTDSASKLKNSKGFFFGTTAEYDPTEKINTDEGLASTHSYTFILLLTHI